ncbi:hypothetical protein GCM10027160_52820 [Streptomyces calidiresistens]
MSVAGFLPDMRYGGTPPLGPVRIPPTDRPVFRFLPRGPLPVGRVGGVRGPLSSGSASRPEPFRSTGDGPGTGLRGGLGPPPPGVL